MELRRAAAAFGAELPADRAERLVAYEALLRDVAVPRGLIARSDEGRLRERHVLDCLRAAVAVEARDRSALDAGSGAGLPGVVVAIARPGLEVALVEPRRTRAAFLELTLERLDLPNAMVLAARIEELDIAVDLVFARAFAPPAAAWEAAAPRLVPGGRLVYFAGAGTEPVAPTGAKLVRVLESPLLESSGPLFIMAR